MVNSELNFSVLKALLFKLFCFSKIWLDAIQKPIEK